MTKNTSKTLFLFMLMLSTMLVMSSNNWLSMWMGLEMNMMAFIPMIMKSKNNFSSESSMMYFLIQSMGSMILLLTVSTNSLIMMSPVMMNESAMTLMTISLLIKMGIAPFHMWMPEIMEKMNWNSCLLLMTWQKLAPMFIMTNIIKENQWITINMMMSTVMGAIGGMNQTSLRKILAYSSISHSSWMLACMKFESYTWIMYFMVYSTITAMLTMTFNKKSMFYINQMNNMTNTTSEKMLMMTTMLSMGGMPPFMGFIPKWLAIQSMINANMIMTMTVMILSNMITLFYYLRMITPMMLMSSITNKWTQKKSSPMTSMMMLNLTLPTVLALTLN
uniref:NADH-ubiquinone oxidoreductase chain 2 n=1 Tax=Valleriola javanica TaxID=236433 RepID=A0A8T9ZVV1_9HEMI|nr:NADH dehydrogenase subunit 2 [Valleriola javanica]